MHATVRQGIEIPFVRYEDIEAVEKQLRAAAILTGTSGPRLRTTTACPGTNWCKSGLIDTFHLAERIEKETGIKCGMDLPHKFKIAISGCANTCTRPQGSEIGIHGFVNAANPDKQIGYIMYLGGCGGRIPRDAFKLNKVFSEDEVVKIAGRVVKFFAQHAKPRQRLAVLIDEVGRERFLEIINPTIPDEAAGP